MEICNWLTAALLSCLDLRVAVHGFVYNIIILGFSTNNFPCDVLGTWPWNCCSGSTLEFQFLVSG